MFLAVEVIVHYKYNETRITPKKITKRKDYDIALIRIDYPVIDDDSGMTLLHGNRFDNSTVMPICLPSSRGFKDTEKPAIAVGLGITRSMEYQRKSCFTDGNGPEVFQRCAKDWV